jgi:hypothetical protein
MEVVDVPDADGATAFLLREADAIVTWGSMLLEAKQAPHGHLLTDTSEQPGLLVGCPITAPAALETFAGAPAPLGALPAWRPSAKVAILGAYTEPTKLPPSPGAPTVTKPDAEANRESRHLLRSGSVMTPSQARAASREPGGRPRAGWCDRDHQSPGKRLG